MIIKLHVGGKYFNFNTCNFQSSKMTKIKFIFQISEFNKNEKVVTCANMILCQLAARDSLSVVQFSRTGIPTYSYHPRRLCLIFRVRASKAAHRWGEVTAVSVFMEVPGPNIFWDYQQALYNFLDINLRGLFVCFLDYLTVYTSHSP